MSPNEYLFCLFIGFSFSFSVGLIFLLIYISGIKLYNFYDKLKNPSKIFCVTHIKHPLLLEDTAGKEIENYGLDYKRQLRNYFAVRLMHRKYEVELYEFGKRLF